MRNLNRKWTMKDRAGPIMYGANGAFMSAVAWVFRRAHVTAGLCCAIVKKKRQEGRDRAEAEVYATAV